jgi:hypothetical protein
MAPWLRGFKASAKAVFVDLEIVSLPMELGIGCLGADMSWHQARKYQADGTAVHHLASRNSNIVLCRQCHDDLVAIPEDHCMEPVTGEAGLVKLSKKKDDNNVSRISRSSGRDGVEDQSCLCFTLLIDGTVILFLLTRTEEKKSCMDTA